jgi:hypothetical protein
MKIKLHFLGCQLIGGLVMLSCGHLTYAGETIYQLRDSNGSTLLTNKKSRYNHLQVEKKTYYPDSNIHSYTNWGGNESSVLPSYSKNKNAFDSIIRQAAQTYGVAEGLIKAVMHTESGFNMHARSPVGAQGLMQLMPATARRFNVSNAFDPQQNIMAGARYLAWLLKRFNGNTNMALAGYNAGEGNVAKYNGIPPFRETQDYVRRVTSRYQNLYTHGVGLTDSNVSGSHSVQGRVVASSANYSNDTLSSPPIQAAKYQRQVIINADGSYTDAPAGSYATTNATAAAKIYLSE